MTICEHREMLVRHLIDRKGFTEAGARLAVTNYIESMAYAAAAQCAAATQTLAGRTA